VWVTVTILKKGFLSKWAIALWHDVSSMVQLPDIEPVAWHTLVGNQGDGVSSEGSLDVLITDRCANTDRST
jgi:hypothetical protein